MALAAALLNLPGDARADADEAAVLASTLGAVERNGDHFRIHLRSGKTKLYGCPPKTDCIAVWLKAYDRAARVFVFQLSDGDIDECSLVDDRTGEVTYLDRVPSFSPSSDVAVELVYGENIASFNQRPAVNIWRRVGGTFKREWSTPLVASYDYSVLGWQPGDRVDIFQYRNQYVPGSRDEYVKVGVGEFSVVREGNGWRIVNGKAQAKPH